MNRWLAGLAGLMLGAAGGFYLGQADRPAAPPPTVTAAAPAAPKPAAEAPAATPAPAQPSAPPATQPTVATPAPPPAKEPFGFKRLLVDTSRPAPEACLQFSEPLSTDPATQYADYLRIEPAIRLAVRVTGARLCLGGLEFRNDYQVTVAAGLPAASGERTRAAERLPLSLGEQPALVSFASSGFILPRQGSDGVGIQTINADTVRIKVSRVGDRILARTKFVQPQNENSWSWREVEPDATTLVWSGEMSIERAHNQRVTTMFPLAEVLKPRRPGAYLIEADIRKPRPGSDDDENDWRDRDRMTASQWVIDTDIALTSLRGADGLTVFARSLDTAKPAPGVTLALLAINNDELGRAVTDASGRAVFAPGLLRGKGGAAPSVVMAFSDQEDYAILDLKRPAFDLSDRGVSGRATPGPVDAYLYTDRGIYRPGETVHVTTLLRDRVAAAMDGVPVTLTINRPDGVAFRRLTLDGAKAGAMTVPFTLGDTASRGLWSAVASLDKSTDPVGRVEFDVQDFVPQRLKVTLSTPATVLRARTPAQVLVNGRFLYGAPAADLEAEGEVKLTPDREPFADHKGYRVGLFDDPFKEQTLPLKVEKTKADGTTSATVDLGALPPTSVALKAAIRIGLFEPGGRITNDRVQLPVVTGPLALAVRPRFSDDRVQENTLAAFDLHAFDDSGKPVERKGVRYAFIDEQWDYNWFYRDGRWQYQVVVRDRPLAEGTVDLAADKPVELSQQVGWGRYRLVVSDPETRAATSLRFRGGWQATVENADTPDKVEVTVSAPQFRPGETAKVNIKPPFAGELLLTVASDKIFETRTLSVPAEGITVDVATSAEWGTGAYVLASFYRPLATGRPRDVVRAIGLAWVGLDLSERTLGVALTVPDLVRPRQTVPVSVKIDRARPDEPVFLTLAAVDEGILQLTRFVSPAPQRYYYGKRRLAIDIRDDYAKLLDGKGPVGQIRSGGDGIGGRGLPVVPTKSVALFSGIVAVAADGTAQVPLEVPDFNGQLRLMAVAVSKSAVGATEKPVTVRDPVVAELVLPRFLAPGDQGRMTLQVHNVDNDAGDYDIRLSASGTIALDGPPQQSYSLVRDGRRLETLPIRGIGSGIGKVALSVSGPGGFAVSREYGITVRSPHYPVTLEQAALQAKDADFRIDPVLLDAFEPGSVSLALGYSAVRGIDVPGLLQSLDRYPFGCTEQLVSRALPLISFNDLALLDPKSQDRSIAARVQDAVDQIQQRADSEGGFGLWRIGDGAATAWLQVYATDFLARAKTAGYDVDADLLSRAHKRLLRSTDRDSNDAAAPYAAYVLARAGQGDIGELRYQHDRFAAQMRSPLALAQLGGALSMMGDRSRAASAFDRARRLLGFKDPKDYYQTPLRDAAAVVAIAAETGQSDILRAVTPQLETFGSRARYTTTQEKAWMLQAADAMLKGAGTIQLAVNNLAPAALGQPAALKPTLDEVRRGYTVGNRGQGDVWRSLMIHGTPKDAPRPLANGLQIEKQILTLDGKPVDLARVRQNDRMVIDIKGRATRNDVVPAVLVDMLPAGFEIEAVILRDENGDSSYPFLTALNVLRTREARDDRFVAAFDLNNPEVYWGSDKQPDVATFRVAYVVRAVTPGQFVVPAAQIEDMYRPEVMARTDVRNVTIQVR